MNNKRELVGAALLLLLIVGIVMIPVSIHMLELNLADFDISALSMYFAPFAQGCVVTLLIQENTVKRQNKRIKKKDR